MALRVDVVEELNLLYARTNIGIGNTALRIHLENNRFAFAVLDGIRPCVGSLCTVGVRNLHTVGFIQAKTLAKGYDHLCFCIGVFTPHARHIAFATKWDYRLCNTAPLLRILHFNQPACAVWFEVFVRTCILHCIVGVLRDRTCRYAIGVLALGKMQYETVAAVFGDVPLGVLVVIGIGVGNGSADIGDIVALERERHQLRACREFDLFRIGRGNTAHLGQSVGRDSGKQGAEMRTVAILYALAVLLYCPHNYHIHRFECAVEGYLGFIPLPSVCAVDHDMAVAGGFREHIAYTHELDIIRVVGGGHPTCVFHTAVGRGDILLFQKESLPAVFDIGESGKGYFVG